MVVRYVLALMLIEYALNKLIPGQFLLYNRDLDLPLRELPARRLAWHFLGYSRTYNGFAAFTELLAGVLLCFRRTVVGGSVLALLALSNVVAVDVSFGLRGALPIATVMAFAALGLVLVHLDLETLMALFWRRGPAPSIQTMVLTLAAFAFVVGYPLKLNLGARRGLGGQVPAAGRFEVLECRPSASLALCKDGAVLYIEVGQWGQLVSGGKRRNLSFRFDKVRKVVDVRIPAPGSKEEPELTLSGTVTGQDSIVVLQGRAESLPPFDVRLRRTHPAPWPPVRLF